MLGGGYAEDPAQRARTVGGEEGLELVLEILAGLPSAIEPDLGGHIARIADHYHFDERAAEFHGRGAEEVFRQLHSESHRCRLFDKRQRRGPQTLGCHRFLLLRFGLLFARLFLIRSSNRGGFFFRDWAKRLRNGQGTVENGLVVKARIVDQGLQRGGRGHDVVLEIELPGQQTLQNSARSIRSVGSQSLDYSSGQTDVTGSEQRNDFPRLPFGVASHASTHHVVVHPAPVHPAPVHPAPVHPAPVHHALAHHAHHGLVHAFHAFHACLVLHTLIHSHARRRHHALHTPHHPFHSTGGFLLGGFFLRFRFGLRFGLGILGRMEEVFKQLYNFRVTGVVLTQKGHGIQQSRGAISLGTEIVSCLPVDNGVGTRAVRHSGRGRRRRGRSFGGFRGRLFIRRFGRRRFLLDRRLGRCRRGLGSLGRFLFVGRFLLVGRSLGSLGRFVLFGRLLRRSRFVHAHALGGARAFLDIGRFAIVRRGIAAAAAQYHRGRQHRGQATHRHPTAKPDLQIPGHHAVRIA